MGYLVTLALVVFLLGYAPQKYGLQSKNYKGYLILAGVLIVLVTGLRSPYTGSPDSFRYALSFEDMAYVSDFREFYNERLSDKDFLVSETGFYFVNWILSRFATDGQTIVFATMAFCTFSVCYFIYKNSEDPVTSLLIYVTLGLLTFNMNGMRQALAMSVCLFGFEFAKKGKIIPFAIIILLAMQFHRTALCFAPVFVLPRMRNKPGDVLFYTFGLVFFMISMDWFIEAYSDLVDKEYGNDNVADGGGISVVLIYAVALLLPIFAKDALKEKPVMTAYYATFTGLACYLCRYFSNQMLERASYYYFYFLALLVPNLLRRLDKKERNAATAIFSVAAIVLFVYRCRNGSFSRFTFFFLD